MARTTRRTALAQLLPPAPSPHWGVVMHYEDGYSDKEYRVLSSGDTTAFQWGRSGADGEINRIEHPDAATASSAARKQWSAKEAKGYWPTTGIMPLDGPGSHRSGFEVVRSLANAYDRHVVRLETSARPGSTLWLCQAPPDDAPGGATRAVHALSALAAKGPGASSGPVAYGQYLLLAAGEGTGALLSAVCPVAVRIGEVADADAVALADVAKSLAGDLEFAEGPRQRLAAALEAARAIMG